MRWSRTKFHGDSTARVGDEPEHFQVDDEEDFVEAVRPLGEPLGAEVSIKFA